MYISKPFFTNQQSFTYVHRINAVNRYTKTSEKIALLHISTAELRTYNIRTQAFPFKFS